MLIESEESADRQSTRRRARRGRSAHECAACRRRRALFQYRGEVRADSDHNLCFQCYRSELNRQRARRLAARRAFQPPIEISTIAVARRSPRELGKAVWSASLIHETAQCA